MWQKKQGKNHQDKFNVKQEEDGLNFHQISTLIHLRILNGLAKTSPGNPPQNVVATTNDFLQFQSSTQIKLTFFVIYVPITNPKYWIIMFFVLLSSFQNKPYPVLQVCLI